MFEILGPRGLTVYVTRLAAPSVRHWQTGIVHDYALILKIAIRIGFSICLLPGGISPNILNFYDSRTLVATVFWLRSLPF